MDGFNKKLDDLFGIDIRALALMRIVFAFLVIIDLLSDFPFLKTIYSNEGVLPNAYAQHSLKHGAFSLFLLSESWGFQFSLIVLLLISCFTLLFGFYTRASTFIVWLLLCSLHNRNLFILGAEDKLLHILFFWFMFLPWGTCWSLDSRNKPQPKPLRICSMATAACLLQISFFYIFAGFIKTYPEWTVDKNALFLVLNIHQFVKPFGESLLTYPALLQSLTTAAWLLERYGPFFFFIPVRTTWFRMAALFCFALFHIGIMLCLELKFFQWICLALLIGFIPTDIIDRICPRPKSTLPITRGQPKTVNVIVAIFLAYVFIWNMETLKSSPDNTLPKFNWIGYTFNLRQYWGMFGPGVMRDDGWFVVPGKQRNGQDVDAFSGSSSVAWEEPPSIQALNKNYHLNLFYLNIHQPHLGFYLSPWGTYLCRQWNNSHPPQEHLMSIDIIYMERHILPDDRKPIIQKKHLLHMPCPVTDQTH